MHSSNETASAWRHGSSQPNSSSADAHTSHNFLWHNSFLIYDDTQQTRPHLARQHISRDKRDAPRRPRKELQRTLLSPPPTGSPKTDNSSSIDPASSAAPSNIPHGPAGPLKTTALGEDGREWTAHGLAGTGGAHGRRDPRHPLTPNSSGDLKDPLHDVPSPSLAQRAISERMSVKSLLTPTKLEDRGLQPLAGARITSTYGFDAGLPDLDLPTNRDDMALSDRTPYETTDMTTHVDDLPPVRRPGGYYAKPVPVIIPGFLKPLPPLLLESPMNMLYFHHFLAHTSKVLVTSDCPENPFRATLAPMAVGDTRVLSLMLAFAACHRARLLGHAEPLRRIATWIGGLAPSIHRAVHGTGAVSDETLIAIVMLCSLSVTFPGAFPEHSSWQDHLVLARRMVKLRGGPGALCATKATFFIRRWFLYLHTWGSISGCADANARADWYSESEATLRNPEFDCFFGFTNHSHTLLWQVADLVSRTGVGASPHGMDWSRAGAMAAAEELREELVHARHAPRTKACRHLTIGAAAIAAINGALRHGAVIHLLRRVVMLPSEAAGVQEGVQGVLGAMRQLALVGPVDTPDVLFSLFVAGAESRGEAVRLEVLGYFESIEQAGMKQAGVVRTLLQRCWERRRDWVGMADGVFLG